MPQQHESLVRFVYANLGIEDPDITLQKVREVLSRTSPSGGRPVPGRHPIEICNLAEVREAISVCVKHERPMAVRFSAPELTSGAYEDSIPYRWAPNKAMNFLPESL